MTIDIGKDLEKFVKLTKEDMEANPPTASDLIGEGESQLALFKGKSIRQVFHDDEWFFSIVDAIAAITETDRPRQYWSDLKKHLAENEGFIELYEEIVQLKMPSSDGKMYKTDCVATETLFRIIQSVPSPKAEPFKKWLAKIAYERIQEYQNPEIAIKRALLIYKVKGYTDEWINARVQTIVSRKELTREWQQRGVSEGLEYAMLTDTISRGTFGIKTKDHKETKGLSKNHNLRDHMTPLELALTMLGETTTAELARNTNAQGFHANETAAKKGGNIAGATRVNIEKQLGKKVVTSSNFLGTEIQEKLPSK